MSYHNDPYRVDYLKIYPCLKERPDVLEVLKKSDRKMKVVIVGGVAGGASAAARIRRLDRCV